MTCDRCEKPPVRNFQKVWISWGIDSEGSYSDEYQAEFGLAEPAGAGNLHLCREHEQAFRRGEL